MCRVVVMRDGRGNKIRNYWERPNTVSLRDENLRELETQAILRWLKPKDWVLDVGCGDGVNSFIYASHVERLIGVDYSEEMLRRARRRLTSSSLRNVEFRNLSVQQLDQIIDEFDVVITQRCLINLTSFDEQSTAIVAIRKLVRPGGLYLMLECVEQGKVCLNELRSNVGLDPLPIPWHDQFFDLDELMPLLRSHFSIVTIKDFSLYYLITRLLNPLMGLDHLDPRSKQIDAAARQLHLQLRVDQLDGIGPQRLFVLRKGSSTGPILHR